MIDAYSCACWNKSLFLMIWPSRHDGVQRLVLVFHSTIKVGENGCGALGQCLRFAPNDCLKSSELKGYRTVVDFKLQANTVIFLQCCSLQILEWFCDLLCSAVNAPFCWPTYEKIATHKFLTKSFFIRSAIDQCDSLNEWWRNWSKRRSESTTFFLIWIEDDLWFVFWLLKLIIVVNQGGYMETKKQGNHSKLLNQKSRTV